MVAASWAGIGEVLLLKGDPSGAIEAFTAALEIFEAVYGKDDPRGSRSSYLGASPRPAR